MTICTRGFWCPPLELPILSYFRCTSFFFPSSRDQIVSNWTNMKMAAVPSTLLILALATLSAAEGKFVNINTNDIDLW